MVLRIKPRTLCKCSTTVSLALYFSCRICCILDLVGCILRCYLTCSSVLYFIQNENWVWDWQDLSWIFGGNIWEVMLDSCLIRSEGIQWLSFWKIQSNVMLPAWGWTVPQWQSLCLACARPRFNSRTHTHIHNDCQTDPSLQSSPSAPYLMILAAINNHCFSWMWLTSDSLSFLLHSLAGILYLRDVALMIYFCWCTYRKDN
jgi:hypothetical protein